jgi:hypothetical protein
MTWIFAYWMLMAAFLLAAGLNLELPRFRGW